MATLRGFQHEMNEIHARELAKQRALGIAEREKENKKVGSKVVEVKRDVVESDAGRPDSSIDLDGMDEEVQSLLLSGETPKYEKARDLIAQLLTRSRGEYICRIGRRPPHSELFAGQPLNDGEEWLGVDRSLEEMDRLHQLIAQIAEEVGGQASVSYESRTNHPRISLLLRLPPPNVSLTPEVRCAVVGNVDSGKSTTLGVLTRGGLDDGRGRARVGLFRHKHELETGRTSSVGMEILGFALNGSGILPTTSNSMDPDTIRREKLGWEEISSQAAKIVSFIDLAGHEKYLKTTLYGLTSGAPACVVLMVGANAGLIGMSKEHLAIALALSIPVVVCITKIDMTPANILQETVKQVVKVLKSPGCRKTPVFVKSVEIAVELSQVYAKERLCPIFLVSNVTGEGLDHVRAFLNLLPSDEHDDSKFMPDQPLEYSITEVWSVPYVGTVVNGIVNGGSVRVGDQVLLGPDANGNYLPTSIKSMQRKRAPVNSAEAGQCVSLALKRMKKQAVRKGMVIVHKTESPPPKAIRRFQGQVLILYHNTTLQKNYQAMLHCGAVRQTVRIIEMNHPQGILRTGDRATVTFEFISHPEFIKQGMKLLFREGKTKGLGVVTQLLD
ncbi:hypothetical protein JAAARDRAFT_209844 [Jaapia argillacea MUCL 33604]|uniref:Tr-type G domain-containing protein n=1 Tax=Jaapia argillacea MUCL 33604 TaxID=933084 RepID=A0A067PF15_9AGAM|nr:hypothetical protein JAAARDRAFT_209844 [Jaapia argillacea MUCL 33604]